MTRSSPSALRSCVYNTSGSEKCLPAVPIEPARLLGVRISGRPADSPHLVPAQLTRQPLKATAYGVSGRPLPGDELYVGVVWPTRSVRKPDSGGEQGSRLPIAIAFHPRRYR